jgi:hypothetical protein
VVWRAARAFAKTGGAERLLARHGRRRDGHARRRPTNDERRMALPDRPKDFPYSYQAMRRAASIEICPTWLPAGSGRIISV